MIARPWVVELILTLTLKGRINDTDRWFQPGWVDLPVRFIESGSSRLGAYFGSHRASGQLPRTIGFNIYNLSGKLVLAAGVLGGLTTVIGVDSKVWAERIDFMDFVECVEMRS